MRYGRKTVDQGSVRMATYLSRNMAEKQVESARRYESDPDREKRLAAGICKACYYFRRERIGGQAMTTRPCGLCEKEMTFSNTATDPLCPECAVQNELCRQCGGDLHLRKERTFTETGATP